MGYVFAYTSLAIALVIAWLMPKHLTGREIYITWGWMAALTIYTDLSFGHIIDLYDFVDPSINFKYLALEAALAPAFVIIFLNFMPERKLYFIFYLIGAVLFSIFLEYLSVLTGYIVYKGWKLWYSVPFYFLGLLYLRWHLFFLRKPKRT